MSPRRSTAPARFAAAAVLAVGVSLIGLAPAGAATATAAVDEAAAVLRSGESVYVDPAADNLLSSAEADQLAAQIRDSGQVFFIAVLPASAAVGGSSDATLQALYEGIRISGTYAVYLGDDTTSAFKGNSTLTDVRQVATIAYRDNKDAGALAVTSAFVTGATAALGGGTAGSGSGSSDSGSGFGILAFFGLIAAAIGGGAWWISRKAKKANAERTAALRRVVDEDVTSYGEAVARLDVDDPRLDEAGRADAQRSLDAYEQAKMLSARMTRPEDAGSVTAALEDGRFALASVEARMDGRPLPERRPPCFVDPRHGPSAEDVEWAPDGGAVRPIPVCLACATTLRSGGLPQAREIEMAGGGRVPYWQGGQAYAPYAGGYFGGAGMNAMSMLFMGSMLGGAFSTPTVIAPTDASGLGDGGGGWSGWDGGGGGGDFGGGDFGGGGDF